MARGEQPSLRFSRFETKWLMIAVLVSLCVHLGGWGGYELSKKYGWWERLQAFMHWHKAQKETPPEAKKEETEEQPPTVYVDVSQADTEPPKKTMYYSDKNSRAANPDMDKESNQPKIDGKQKDIVKTEDVVALPKLQPIAPQEPPQQETPQPSPNNLGDQELSKNPPTDQKTPQQQRPRTIKEAMAQKNQMVGQKIRQDGGVHRIQMVTSLDAKSTAFGQYDGAILQAIQQYWSDELERNRFAQDRTGRVMIKFILHYDGSVDHVEIEENDVGTLLSSYCQEAIDQTAPYGKWPDDMLHMIGSTVRPVTITFIYY